MATKDQVLKLLEKGLNPQQIAKKLGCKDGYVRATKARAFGNGREVQRRYDEAHKAERRAWMRDYKRERRATDPEYREYEREHSRKRYQNDPEYRERKRISSLRYYHARKAEQSQSAN
ncbi:hypothetical protein [Hyphomicrobium sp. ghe19]|uniref:hypothetical protein n=1 Tax=Hyphomicrobium sp. ghe19 TaxID=2682968 RepID=UPI0013672197|nr:hypothetical protein HYPP_01496 [Hyphomicrobium sp. ghe19]